MPWAAPAWLLIAAVAASLPVPAGCRSLAESSAFDLAREINRDRLAAGLAPVALRQELCVVAAERAAGLARAGSMDSDAGAIAWVSQRLFALGYRAQRWSEQPVLRRGAADKVLGAWRQRDTASYRAAIFGDVADLGVGAAELDGAPLTLLLFALPRHAAFLREAAAMGSAGDLRDQLVAAANAERRRVGLEPLVRTPVLDRAAQAHAEDLVRRGYYDHQTPEGVGVLSRLERTGFHARLASENLARGPFSPADAVARWLMSSGHRANLLSSRTDRVGAGVALDEAAEAFTFVLDFAAGTGPDSATEQQ